MKICKQCGKTFIGTRSFCSKRCANKWYNKDDYVPFRAKEKQEHIEDCIRIKKLIEAAFCQSMGGKYSFNNTIKRIYCYVCKELKGYSTTETARGISVDHTTVIHHLRRIRTEEIEKAKIFFSNMEHEEIKIKPKLNIYERTGFRYDNGKKEVSTVWKRVYGIQRQRGCLSWGL